MMTYNVDTSDGLTNGARGDLLGSSLNCRSLKKHYEDILEDTLLLKSDIIALQETWLENDITLDKFKIAGYDLHLNSHGNGKGLAIYFKKDLFNHKIDIKEENMQLSKFSSSNLNIVIIYRSQNGNLNKLKQNLEAITTKDKPELILGDFNFDFPTSPSNPTKLYLQDQGYTQLIHEPTHLEGNILDHAYCRDVKKINQYITELHSKYFTDHRGLAIMVRKANQT